nr:MAG TPA: hypothetical protein [Caudoviricetes sp.]
MLKTHSSYEVKFINRIINVHSRNEFPFLGYRPKVLQPVTSWYHAL